MFKKHPILGLIVFPYFGTICKRLKSNRKLYYQKICSDVNRAVPGCQLKKSPTKIEIFHYVSLCATVSCNMSYDIRLMSYCPLVLCFTDRRLVYFNISVSSEFKIWFKSLVICGARCCYHKNYQFFYVIWLNSSL